MIHKLSEKINTKLKQKETQHTYRHTKYTHSHILYIWRDIRLPNIIIIVIYQNKKESVQRWNYLPSGFCDEICFSGFVLLYTRNKWNEMSQAKVTNKKIILNEITFIRFQLNCCYAHRTKTSEIEKHTNKKIIRMKSAMHNERKHPHKRNRKTHELKNNLNEIIFIRFKIVSNYCSVFDDNCDLNSLSFNERILCICKDHIRAFI